MLTGKLAHRVATALTAVRRAKTVATTAVSFAHLHAVESRLANLLAGRAHQLGHKIVRKPRKKRKEEAVA